MANKRFFLLLFSLLLLFSGLGVLVVNAMSGAEDAANKRVRFYSYAGGVGAGGYDLVAYFDESAAVPGDAAHEFIFGGMPWHFSSAENRDKFAASPQKYLPRYGGHCAYGVAGGYLVRGDPTAWSVRDGVLYFNYNKTIRNAWLADAAGFIRKSENNWPQLNK